MMMGGDSEEARAEARMQGLLGKALRGAPRTVQDHRRRARRIARWLLERHGVRSPYKIRAKHLRAFLDHAAATHAPSTVYLYWRTALLIARRLGREEAWYPYLRGPWSREGPGGRPRK